MFYFIGIDPGLDGGIATLTEDGRIAEINIMPVIKGKETKREYDIQRMSALVNNFPKESTTVILEKQQAFHGQGVTSMFSIGKGYGIWLGILSALKIKYEVVHSKTWQKIMLNNINKIDTKQAAAIIVDRIFPGTDFRATERCKKKHEGIVDAILMAEYGRRKHLFEFRMLVKSVK